MILVRKFQGCLIGFAPAGTEERSRLAHPLRDPPLQSSSQLLARKTVDQPAVAERKSPGLLSDGGDDLLYPIADVDSTDTAGSVEVSLALVIKDVRTFASNDRPILVPQILLQYVVLVCCHVVKYPAKRSRHASRPARHPAELYMVTDNPGVSQQARYFRSPCTALDSPQGPSRRD